MMGTWSMAFWMPADVYVPESNYYIPSLSRVLLDRAWRAYPQVPPPNYMI